MPPNSKILDAKDLDKDTLKAISEGNEQAFGALFYKYLQPLFSYTLKFSGSAVGAQEIIQETFIRVWLHRDQLPEIQNLNGWIFKLASNECYTYLRKKVLTDKFANPILDEPAPVDAVQEWQDARDLKRLVTEAVDSLPAQRQKIYRMSRNEGLSIHAIAEALQLSPNTVKNTLVASLKTIREHLEKAGVHWLLILVATPELFF